MTPFWEQNDWKARSQLLYIRFEAEFIIEFWLVSLGMTYIMIYKAQSCLVHLVGQSCIDELQFSSYSDQLLVLITTYIRVTHLDNSTRPQLTYFNTLSYWQLCDKTTFNTWLNKLRLLVCNQLPSLTFWYKVCTVVLPTLLNIILESCVA